VHSAESKLPPALSYLRDIEFLVVDDFSCSRRIPPARMRSQGPSPRGAAVLAASCVAPRHCQRSRARWTASQGIARSPWPPLTAAELRHVVDSLAAQRGLPLSAETARLIAERSGGDLGVVQGLLTQLGAAMRWPTKDAAAAALVRLYSTGGVWIAEAASTRIPGSRGPHPVRSDGRAQTTRTEVQAPADSANPRGVGDGGTCIAPVCRTPLPPEIERFTMARPLLRTTVQ